VWERQKRNPRKPKPKNKYSLYLWDSDLTITKWFKQQGQNPYMADIEAYLLNCVVPTVVRNFLTINPKIANRFAIRWLWDYDWSIFAKTTAIIYNTKMDQGYPEELIGGMGWWELYVDGMATHTRFKTAWNTLEGTFECTINHDRLRQITSDYVEMPVKVPNYAMRVPSTHTIGYLGSEKGNVKSNKTEFQEKLERDLEGGLISMKFTKKSIDYEKVARVCKVYEDENPPTEHAYNEIISKAIMDYMKIKVPSA